MPVFDYSFTVNAPLEAVAEFHRNPLALKQLTPPPMLMQVHRFEPLSEGSVSDFTLWLGPVPFHWIAIHSNVDFPHGFTDTQQQGPMKYWAHTHTFTAESEQVSRVSEHIEYEYRSGLPGLLSRLLFSGPGLTLLFTYRKMMTRRYLRKSFSKR